MSDDESVMGDEVGSRVYNIVEPDYRSAEATKFLRKLDGMYVCLKYTLGSGTVRGNWPRRRRPSKRGPEQQTPIGKVPKHMPRSFYDAEWLSTQTKEDIEDLDIDDSVNLVWEHTPENEE